MRDLGFTKNWPKLALPKFTTFRFTRKDRDWQVGETVHIVLKPRCRLREVLGLALITEKEQRWIHVIDPHDSIPLIGDDEARDDGFLGRHTMVDWMSRTHKGRNYEEPMNKLTLRWLTRPKEVLSGNAG